MSIILHNQVNRRMKGLLRGILGELSLLEYEVLDILSQHKVSRGVDMAKIMYVKAPLVTNTVNKLLDHGLVEVTTTKDADSREKYFKVSKMGKALYGRLKRKVLRTEIKELLNTGGPILKIEKSNVMP